ncbi:MAG: aminopeptidase N [Porticoccaceae bacterium]|nr:aminopeptidase N [Porticoccaceae bacterium]
MGNKKMSSKNTTRNGKCWLWLGTALSCVLLASCGSRDPLASDQQTQPRPVSEFLYASTAELRAKQLSNVSYDLEFSLDKQGDSFSGVTAISFDLIADNNHDLSIDLNRGIVHSITKDGSPIKYSYDKWFISIPASELSAGENTLVITYDHPYATDGSGLHRFVDPQNGEIYLYTDFEPYDAHRLFPHFDQPDLKASYSMQVSAPDDWQVISSTRESSIKQVADKRVWTFPTSAVFSSYIFSLHGGNYAVWEDQFEDIPLRLFARQSLAQYVNLDEWFIPTKQSFGFFNQYFGIPYPFGKYDQIIVPDFNAGAMENVGAVTFNEVYIAKGEKSTLSKMRLANVIAHEMAHMWFGDLVTMRWWNGLWLNESFATYMANLALSKASDFDNVWEVFYARTKQWAYRTDDSINTHPIELIVPSTGEAMTNFDGITYGKGASVLKQLPYYLGEENFRQGVSNYLKKFSYKNTDLDDFIGELGRAADMELSQWTQDWLYQAGLNTIKVDYGCTNNRLSELNITQTAPEGFPTLREQRVQVGLYNVTGNGLTLTSAVPVTYMGAKTRVTEAEGLRCPELVYPNEADWGYVKVDLDEKSLAIAKQYINKVDNSMMRLMLWQSLIDSVNDANLSAETFVEFAMANVAGETDYNVARAIGGGILQALDYLTTATRLGVKDYNAVYADVENLHLELLRNAAAGSDLQKYWYSNYVDLSKNSAHLKHLRAILDGSKTYVGLTIDQDKRWAIVAHLNRYQFGDYKALLASEILRDKSDIGVKYAIYSETMRPDPDIKSKWFDVLTENPEQLKLATLRYIMAGLFPPEQATLEAPFKARILAQIPILNQGNDLGLTRSFAGNMLPAHCTAESEVEMATLVEEYAAMKPQILKAVKARHQTVGRCIKALALL